MIIRTFCITLPETPERKERARAHFSESGIHQVEWFNGVHAEKMGLSTLHPYELDHPGSGFRMGFKPTGIWLSHYILWNILSHLYDDYFLVLEDDAKFLPDWHPRFVQALNDVPGDFDALYIGSCCCNGRPTKHVKGEVYEVKYPLCSHAVVWARKAIATLLATHRKCYAPIDISVTLHSFDKLKVYTVLPRLVEQFDTVISA